jgi:hypothetical protein
VINNIFNPAPYDAWPTVFNLLEAHNPSIDTAVIADWKYINDIGAAGAYPVAADDNIFVPFDTTWENTDDDVTAATIARIAATQASDASFIFSYQVAVDEAGHAYGGGSPEYAAAIVNTSENIAAIMVAVDAWETANPGEEWTVIVTTDHGHQQSVGFGHGFQSPNETSSFVIFDLEGDGANDGKQNLGYSNADITPTIVSLFDVPLRSDFDGVPMQSNAAVVGELRRATFRAPDERVSHNRAFVDILPPRGELVRAALRSESPVDVTDSGDVVAAIARPMWHGLTPLPATGVIVGFVVLWALLAGAAARVPAACACVRCGSPTSPRVDGPAVPPKTCAACFHVFLSTKSRVEATAKVKKERAIVLRGRTRGRLVTILALWPGAGHLFAGVVGTGAALAAVFGFCVAAAAVVADGVVPGIRPTSPWSDAVVVAPFVVVAVLVFIVGFRSALGVAHDERAGGRM